MKILHINSYFNGGFFYKHLYDQQESNGLEIKVYVPVPKDRALISSDFGTYSLVRPSFYYAERYIFHLKSRHIYRDLLKAVDVEKYDILHAHTLFSNGHIACKLKKRYGIPYMVTVRNTDINTFFRKMKFLRPLGVKILEEADCITFLSDSYLEKTIEDYVPEKLKASIREKSRIIVNGIDPFWLEHKGEVKKLRPDESLHLLAVGNISRNKNIGTTLEVMDQLKENGIKAHLHAVGKVKDEELHERLLRHPDATYYAYMSKENLLNLYRKCHIFILPSHQETFGNVYPEALSQGLPILYTMYQGFHGQFDEGVVGYGVDSSSVSDIFDKILRIKNDYQNFSERALSGSLKYQWKNITKAYELGYANILKRNEDNEDAIE